MISAAFAALIVAAAPAIAQRHPGPSNLRDADHSSPTTAIAVPALIRDRLQPGQAQAPSDDSTAATHVKAFKGGGGDLSAGEPQPVEAAKPILSVRKAGEPPSVAEPDAGETAAPRMQSQNNLKQIGLANH
jgi:hypothetical protein